MSKMSRSEAGKLGALKTNQLWISRYESNPKNCLSCNNVLPYEKRKNKFCGHSCSASFNNLGIRRNGNGLKNYKFECLFCKNSINNMKYCSYACHKNHQWQILKTQIELSGKATSVGTAKRYLVEQNGKKCSLCGITEWQSKLLVFVLDHINGNPYDWNLTNLRLLCPNCDSQTPTYKGKNVGNGRHSRRQRYKEGKSY